MEPSLKHSALVLLTVAALLVSGQVRVTLDHDEKKVDVAAGSSLTLHCKLELDECETIRVHWLFLPSSSGSGSSPGDSRILREVTVSSTSGTTEWQDSAAKTYFIANVTDEHSGWYHCKLTGEIPYLKTVHSNKSQVVIKSLTETTAQPSLVTRKQAMPDLVPENPPPLMDWWMWMVLGLSILALFLLLLMCVALRRRCRSRREDPIYTNTRPVAKQPSPRPRDSANNLNVNTLKVAPSPANLRPQQSPSRKSYEGAQRYRT